ncbi:helix-turn-helix domain-containing protein [Burkholderia vietnamiensis]|uniref:helix-turn-helix domain-containing protein n=1 Tax=Burkholderia vietnamiensis TaxID=60552 RepID=UPI001CF1E43C|nr:helix-turn-helix domain-containing protein [Burkholderia vietnamiensis]
MLSHLSLLRELFPDKILLSVEDIAKVLNVSKQHIYNQSSEKRLPFRCVENTDRIFVSIVELARYLDEATLTKESPSSDYQPAQKKPGRPRGSTKR